jgi:glycosyltransferase involved in cell wall biosynthesis
LRIALVTRSLPLGGTTTFTLSLASGLRALQVPVEVFSVSRECPLAAEFEHEGIPLHREDEERSIFEDRVQAIYQGLRRFRPSAVFAVYGREAFEILRYLPDGVLRVGIAHDLVMRPAQLASDFHRTLDHMVAVADYLRPHVELAQPPPRCTYLQLGVPLNGAMPRRPHDPEAPLRLLYYGRLEEGRKRVRIFPEIARELDVRQVRYEWTVCGEGAEEAWLRERLASSAYGRVRFSRPVPRRSLGSLIREHDVYVLTSDHEGGPLTLLESMSLGLVPVCGDIPGLVQEIIDSGNGIRVPFADAPAYAEAIASLYRDRRLLQRMSAAARETIREHMTAEAMAGRYVEFVRAHVRAVLEPVWPERVEPLRRIGADSVIFAPLLRWPRRLRKRLRAFGADRSGAR